MITAEAILTRIIDAVPPGAPLDGWFRHRGGEGVRRAAQRALDRRMQQDTGGRMQPDPEIVPDQFAPREVVAFDPATIAPEATGPSPERRAALLAERDALTPKTWSRVRTEAYRAQERIKAINKELAGNEAQKDVAKWLKARSKKGLGSFDIDTVRGALPYLPGWTVAETVVSGTETANSYADDTLKKGWRWAYQRDFREKEAPKYRVVPAGKDHKPILPADAIPEDRLTYITEGPIYASDGYRVLFRHPTVLYRVWRFTAPSGEQKDVPTYAEAADGLYKWAYTQGLAEQAAAVVGAAEAAVPRAASTGEEWARNLCQVCFSAHALAPKARTLVDHAHKRPGWGYNVSPCPGSKYPSYAESCVMTDTYMQGLIRGLTAHRARLAVLNAGHDAGGTALTFTVKVYVTERRYGIDAKVYEPSEDRRKRYGDYKVEEVTAQPGTALWADARAAEQARTIAEIRSLVAAIPFYRAAVRLWPPAPDATVAAVFARIQHGISPEDKVGL